MKLKNKLIQYGLSLLMAGVLLSCNQQPKQSNQKPITAEEAKELAKDAFLFGMPVVFLEKQFDFNSYVTKPEGTKAPVNQFAHFREFVDASNRLVVGFNVDNLYSFASLDLKKEPVILSMPAMGDRYWIMQLIDGWNGVPAAPGSRTHGGKAVNFAIVGPDWSGQLPEGVEELRSPTYLTLIGGRTACTGASDYVAANALQDQYKLTPLSQWGNDYTPPTNVPLKEGADGTTLVNKQFMSLSAEQFFKNLNRLLVDNPAYAADSTILGRIEPLGIKPGADFSLSAFNPEVAKAIEEGYALGQNEMMEGTKSLGEKKNNWTITYDMGRYGTRYAYRASWTFVGMGGNLLEDAIYPTSLVDSDDNTFDGANNYTLTFKKEEVPPAAAFWSLTIYDLDGYLVDNKLNRYALGDRTNMKSGTDGSLTIYIQHESPGKNKESNWLPSPPSGPFRLVLRLYIPKECVLNKSWAPPAVEKNG